MSLKYTDKYLFSQNIYYLNKHLVNSNVTCKIVYSLTGSNIICKPCLESTSQKNKCNYKKQNSVCGLFRQKENIYYKIPNENLCRQPQMHPLQKLLMIFKAPGGGTNCSKSLVIFLPLIQFETLSDLVLK